MTNEQRILLVGCGNMGAALLRGWLEDADKEDAPWRR